MAVELIKLALWVVGVTFVIALIWAILQQKAESDRNEAVQLAANGLQDRMLRKFPDYFGRPFIGGDTLAMIINEKKRMALVTNQDGVAKEIPFSSFRSIEIQTNGVTTTQTTRKGGITRALAGGVLLGGAGAIVGALTAQQLQTTSERVSSIAVSLTTDDPHFPVLTWFIFRPIGVMTDLADYELTPHMINATRFYNQFAPIFTLQPDEEQGLISI